MVAINFQCATEKHAPKENQKLLQGPTGLHLPQPVLMAVAPGLPAKAVRNGFEISRALRSRLGVSKFGFQAFFDFGSHLFYGRGGGGTQNQSRENCFLQAIGILPCNSKVTIFLQ